jgi:MFS family permease
MSDARGERLLADPRLLAVLSVTATAVMANQAAPVALPGISTDLGVPEGDVGLVITAFFLPASVMLLVVGSLADVYGRKRVVVPSLFVFGAAGVGIFFVDSFAALLALRGLQGAAFPALTPLSTAIIGDLYEGPAGATAQGLRSSANGLAGIVGPALAGALAGIAWQYPFLMGAAAFPVLAVVAVALPETAGLEASEGAGNPVAVVAEHLRGLGGEFTDPNLRLLAVGGGVIYLTKFAVMTFVPLLAVRTFGAGAFAAGLLLSVRGLVRIGAAPLSGRLVEATSRTRALAGSLCLAAGGTALLPVLPAWLEGLGPLMPGVPAVPPLVTLAVLMGAYSAGEALFNPVLNDTVIDIADPERRASVVHTVSVFKNGASALSPAVFGLVLTANGFPPLFALAAAVPVGYAVLLVVRFDGAAADAETEGD